MAVPHCTGTLRPGCARRAGPIERRLAAASARSEPSWRARIMGVSLHLPTILRKNHEAQARSLPARREASLPNSAQGLAASSEARLERELAGQSFSSRGRLRLLWAVCNVPRALGIDLALRADRRPHDHRAASRRPRLGAAGRGL